MTLEIIKRYNFSPQNLTIQTDGIIKVERGLK